MTQFEGRQAYLKKGLNKHLRKLTDQGTDFFSKLNHGDLMELKTVLADINNLLTLKMTLAAMEWICGYFEFDKATKDKNIKKVDDAKPNTNGFDIHITEPLNIIAEVKCTSPVNKGEKFGAAQHDSIMDDVGKLIHGKGKVSDTTNFYKFLFLIDLGDRTDKAITQFLPVTKGKSETANKYNELKKYHLHWLKDDHKTGTLDTKKVYLKKIRVK